MKTIFYTLSLLVISIVSQAQLPAGCVASANKWPVVSNQYWNSNSTWNNNQEPATGQIVCIPAGTVVKLKNNVYKQGSSCFSDPAKTPQLVIFVYGTLEFESSAKLYLDCGSLINVLPGGSITSGNTSSLKIQIGPNEVWGGSGPIKQQTLNGPLTISQSGIAGGSLPLSMNEFRGRIQNNNVQLAWSTIQETATRSFNVERSSDLRTWTSVGSIAAAGNSAALRQYSFTDPTPVNGTTMYRLKMIDEDGMYQYSGVVQVAGRIQKQLSIYPNPVVGTTNIFIEDGIKGNQSVLVINSNGMLVKTIASKAGNLLQFDASSLSPGLYLIRVVEEGHTLQQTSFIKQ